MEIKIMLVIDGKFIDVDLDSDIFDAMPEDDKARAQHLGNELYPYLVAMRQMVNNK